MLRRLWKSLCERTGLTQLDTPVDEFCFKQGRLISESEIQALNLPLNKNIANTPGYPEAINSLNERGNAIVHAMLTSSPGMLSRETKNRNQHIKHIQSIWGNAIDKLRILIEASSETGDAFRHQYFGEAIEQTDFTLAAVVRLHARSCLLAQEVLWLLEGGFPSAAMSRWRTLHETAVVMLFISTRGQDVAERYLLHNGRDIYESAKDHQKHAATLGPDYEPLTTDEMNRYENMKRDLCSRFGDSYWSQWGWAAHALGKKNPPFTEIEAAVELDYLRPFFKMACHSNHAGSRGIWFDLGIPESSMAIMLAGSSDAGFYDPGASTAISITHASRAMLGLRPSETAVVTRLVIEKLAGLCNDAFVEAEERYRVELGSQLSEHEAQPG